MLIGAAILWRRRVNLARHELPSPSAEGKSSFLVGLTIAGVELPTAFPYFAAIAAIVGSGLGAASQVIALAVYNIVFVMPLILIVITITVAGDRSQAILEKGRDLLQRHWPALLASLALIAGVYVAALGITGLVSGGHGAVSRVSRTIRHTIAR
jgi:cytochrome c biogenesis protein CcdA